MQVHTPWPSALKGELLPSQGQEPETGHSCMQKIPPKHSSHYNLLSLFISILRIWVGKRELPVVSVPGVTLSRHFCNNSKASQLWAVCLIHLCFPMNTFMILKALPPSFIAIFKHSPHLTSPKLEFSSAATLASVSWQRRSVLTVYQVEVSLALTLSAATSQPLNYKDCWGSKTLPS